MSGLAAATPCRLGAMLAVLALGLSACGGAGSHQVSAGSYVKSICRAVAPFERDLQSRSSALNLSAVTNPRHGKHGLREFLSTAAADDQRAVNALKAAGTPQVKNGKHIAGAIIGAFTQLHGALQQALSAAATLPTSSAAAFKSSALALEDNVRNSMTSIGSSLGGLHSSELQEAARLEPSCQSLSG